MARISKAPEERRQELIETAKELFMIQGYEQTTVGDIVKQVGVAQGLFYYYFKSKQEIFLEVINQFMEARVGELAAFLRDKSIPPPERVRNLMHVLMSFMSEMDSMSPKNRENMVGEMTAITHYHVSELIEPMVTELLKEGLSQGLMSVPFPERLGRFVISGLIGVQNMSPPPKADEMMAFILFVLERLLNIPQKIIEIGD